MNAMDRIHHVEHRRRPRSTVAFERAGSAAVTDDAVAITEPRHPVPAMRSADDYAD